MTWTGSPSTAPCGRLAAAQLANLLETDMQNQRAARVVAGRAIDCAEMLAMLGLDVPVQRVATRNSIYHG